MEIEYPATNQIILTGVTDDPAHRVKRKMTSRPLEIHELAGDVDKIRLGQAIKRAIDRAGIRRSRIGHPAVTTVIHINV